ncbi:hypothetical protein [Paracoccus sp. (in: a-proteobacteria)]|uniref:hypothetical protein n=1 Tax=Paracoccus sp. TaxID=267 RepID=UPI00396CAE5F
MRQILDNAAAEARRLTKGLKDLDRDLGAALESHSPDALPDIQQADLLRQEAEGLAHFLSALARQVDPQWLCNPGTAAGDLGLQSQVGRLANRATPPEKGGMVDLWGLT